MRKHWTFLVDTARHVVFNSEEAAETRIDLFYDDDTSDIDGRMESVWVSGFVNSDLKPGSDVSSMSCATCDEALGERLKSINRQWLSRLGASKFSSISA